MIRASSNSPGYFCGGGAISRNCFRPGSRGGADPRNSFTLQQIALSYLNLGALCRDDRGRWIGALAIVPDNTSKRGPIVDYITVWKADNTGRSTKRLIILSRMDRRHC